MSNFGSKLAEILENHNMRQSELGRATGISDALLSKWINGQQKYVAVEDLARLTAAISSDFAEQADLIKAHLLDEMERVPGATLIDIHIGDHATAREAVVPYQVPLPLKLRRAFDLLMRESITDADVRAVIVGLANTLARAEDLDLDDEAASVNSAKVAAAVNETVDYLANKKRPKKL